MKKRTPEELKKDVLKVLFKNNGKMKITVLFRKANLSFKVWHKIVGVYGLEPMVEIERTETNVFIGLNDLAYEFINTENILA
jgi:predicted transcriptional regulator